MNRKPTILLIALMLVSLVACNKNDADIPIPVEAPEVPKIEKPAEEVKPTPPPKVEPVAEPKKLPEWHIENNPMDDVYFEFDKSDLTEETRSTLKRYAEVLKANAGVTVLVEGHCDERGTDEYNLALGERRAVSVRDYLVNLGVSLDRLKTISYGENRPKVNRSDEEAWAVNRRAHFLVSR